MTTTEADRHHLIERAVEVLGREAAMTLADHLPPTGWADVATKTDLRTLEERLDQRFDQRFDRMDDRFGRIEDRFGHIEERFGRIDERFDELRAYVDHLDTCQQIRLEGVTHQIIGSVHETVTAQTRIFIFAMISTLASIGGLGIAVAQLQG